MKIAKSSLLTVTAGKPSAKLTPEQAKLIADLLMKHARFMSKVALIDEEDPKLIKYYKGIPDTVKQFSYRIKKSRPLFTDEEVDLIEEIADDTSLYEELEKLIKAHKIDRNALPPVLLGASVKVQGAVITVSSVKVIPRQPLSKTLLPEAVKAKGKRWDSHFDCTAVIKGPAGSSKIKGDVHVIYFEKTWSPKNYGKADLSFDLTSPLASEGWNCPMCMKDVKKPLYAAIFSQLPKQLQEDLQKKAVTYKPSGYPWFVFSMRWVKRTTEFKEHSSQRMAPEVVRIDYKAMGTCPIHGKVAIYDTDVMD